MKRENINPKVISPTQFISRYLKKRKTRFAIAVFWSVLFVIVPMQVPILTGALVDGIHGKHVKIFGIITLHESHKEILEFVFIGLITIALLYGLAAYFRTTSIAKLSRQVVVEIRKQLIQKLETLSLDIHRKFGSGELLSRAVLDTGSMRPFIENTFVKTSTNIVRIVYPVSMLFVLEPFLALIASSVIPVQWLITRYLQKKLRKATRKQRTTHRHLTSLVKESLDGIETIQTSTAERYSIERISKQAEILESDQLATGRYTGMISAVVWVMTSIGLALTCSSIVDHHNALPLQAKQGGIEFRNISLSYTVRWVLRCISLKIEPHTLTVIMGKNGSGKSSLLKLIVRLYDPTDGQILVDGQDIRKVQLESLRSQIAVVPQSPVIFNGTLKENVRLAKPDATDKEVEMACESAGVLKFSTKLEKGLDTELGVGAINPSGGEAQRIAIARALVRKPKILLLDEPSSALDIESESSLVRILDELKKTMTIILVSHREKVISNADRLIVLDGGRIASEKTRNEILQFQDGNNIISSTHLFSKSIDPIESQSVNEMVPKSISTEHSVTLHQRAKQSFDTNSLALTIKNLSKTYESATKIVALDRVNLSVRKGEFVSIVGPSGSGKSTLLNMIGALDRPTSGNVYINGIDIFSMDDHEIAKVRNNLIGFIFQSFNLINRATVLDNVKLPFIMAGKSQSEASQRAMKILEALGIADKAMQKPINLSGGQQQRVAIARALINNPAIILADEPTGNLDTKTGRDLFEMLKTLSHKFNRTIIMVTHNPELAKSADRSILLQDGRVESDVIN